MRRHEFRPGKLFAGLTLLTAGVIYGGEATGFWEAAWWTAIPLLAAGLSLAGLAAFVNYRVRRRSRSQASTESTGAPASSKDTQPMR